VLEKFIVNGEHIQVRTGMGNVDVTEYRRPMAPAPAHAPGASRSQSVPTPQDSIYNRSLYPQANQPGGQGGGGQGGAQRPAAAPAAAQPRPGGPAGGPAAPARPGAAPAQPGAAQPAKDDKGTEGGEKRFRLIELD
jgi:hypothetical protein